MNTYRVALDIPGRPSQITVKAKTPENALRLAKKRDYILKKYATINDVQKIIPKVKKIRKAPIKRTVAPVSNILRTVGDWKAFLATQKDDSVPILIDTNSPGAETPGGSFEYVKVESTAYFITCTLTDFDPFLV